MAHRGNPEHAAGSVGRSTFARRSGYNSSCDSAMGRAPARIGNNLIGADTAGLGATGLGNGEIGIVVKGGADHVIEGNQLIDNGANHAFAAGPPAIWVRSQLQRLVSRSKVMCPSSCSVCRKRATKNGLAPVLS